MANRAALLFVLAGAAMPQAAVAVESPAVIACNIPARSITGAPPTAGGERIFRIAPKSLQAWDPVQKAFGPNLCSAYSCTRTAGRTEGTIGSASVTYTLGVAGGQGYWRVMGASGGGPRSGTCRRVREPGK